MNTRIVLGVIMFIEKYNSPLGEITMTSSDGESLDGLWIDGQTNYLDSLIKSNQECVVEYRAIFKSTSSWLDRYFSGEKPNIDELKLAPKGSEFRLAVWEILCGIPYGETMTYGEIAKIIAEQRELNLARAENLSNATNNHTLEDSVGNKFETIKKHIKISAQAVGGAVGHNPISIIIPCHRVVGKDGNLVGFGGGIELKKKLLALEGIDLSKFHDPRK